MTAAVRHGGRFRRSPPPMPVGLLAAPLLLFLAASYFWPVGNLLASSVTEPRLGLQQYRQLFGTWIYLHVFLDTFALAASVTIVTLVIAYPVAYSLSVATERQRRWLIFFILVPSWTSILVRTFGWLILLGRHGMINGVMMKLGVIHQPIQFMFNSRLVELAMVEILLPFMVLPLNTTMRSIEPGLVEAASGLGASRFQAFLRIYLPLSLPGIVAGSSIVFVLSLGFFITPALLGSTHDITVAMLIMQQFTALLNWGFGAALATLLLGLALLVLAGFGLVARVGNASGEAG